MLLIGLLTLSCSKEGENSNTPPSSSELSLQSFEYSAATPAVGMLGRTLFYDKNLSKNGSVSCGSCHKQSKAFADDKPFSTGFDGESTVRNTPPIQNLTGAFFISSPVGLGQALFWDGRSRNLREMIFEPTTNHIEMGLGSPSDLIDRIENKGYYRELFINAFGNSEITYERISQALGGFVASMVSHSSPFEQAIITFGPLDQLLSPQEIQGFNLFVEKYQCMTCHDVVSTFGYSESFGGEFVNIGLDDEYADKGLASLTGNESDNGKFRIPNLRNIALTAPYMHDGRFETLEEVIDHYSDGVSTHPNLDHRLRDAQGMAEVQNITVSEKAALVAFLNSLTDHTFTNNPAFSDPFTK